MIGLVMNVTRRSRMNQLPSMPMAMATTEWKIRVLSSSRCSRKLIEGMRSSSAWGASSVGTAGMGCVMRGGIYCRRRTGTAQRIGARRVSRRLDGPCRRCGRKDLLLFFPLLLLLLVFQLADFSFDLCLEFVRRPFEFVQRLADLARDRRQLLRPEQQQG